ncbi:MAG TPA: pitrilysin family protein [Polyangiaceae bacterium]|nr:pitrilysin family protein [Polyangiaceae bacterium]
MKLSELTGIEQTLSSGLRLLALPQPAVHRAVVHAQIRVGSRFESPSDNGVSHFLEHVLYRGTKEFPSAHELAREIERWGGSLDAATAADAGTLSLTAPPENLERLIPIFAEVFQRPILQGLDIERGIVREELLEGLDEAGASIDADDLIRECSFEGHGLGQPIAGTLTQLETFDRPKLFTHHARHYTAVNSVLVASGNLDAERILAALSANFDGLPEGAPTLVQAPAAQQQARFSFVRNSGSQTQLRIAFRAPGWDSADEAAMEVLARLMDDGMSTRLYRRLCDELGLCYEVSGGYEVYTDAGLLELHAETSHENALRVLGEIFNLVRDLRDRGPEASELQAVLQRYRWQAEGMLDDPYVIADFAADALQGERPWSIAHQVERLAGVTQERLRNVAERWLTAANLSVVLVGAPSRADARAAEQLLQRFA